MVRRTLLGLNEWISKEASFIVVVVDAAAVVLCVAGALCVPQCHVLM